MLYAGALFHNTCVQIVRLHITYLYMKSKKDYIEVTVWISKDFASAYGLFLSNKLTDNEINIEVNRKFPKYYKWEKR